MRRRFWLLICAVTALVVGLGGGSAYAYFTSSGSGSGSATVAGAPNAVTIATNATSATPLQPGGTGDLVITATNPNNYPVQITAFSIGTVTGCTTPDVSLVSPSSDYLPFTIPKNASSERLVIVGSLTMGAGASNDCQGKSLTIPLTATVQK